MHNKKKRTRIPEILNFSFNLLIIKLFYFYCVWGGLWKSIYFVEKFHKRN